MPPPVVAVPVAVHRWFADNEGWAYHTSLKDRMRELIDVVDRDLKAVNTGDFVLAWQGGWLVGERQPDRACINEDAARRLPTIFRVAAVTDPPAEREKAALLAALRAMPLPDRKGAQEGLVVQLRPPAAAPTVMPGGTPARKGVFAALFGGPAVARPQDRPARSAAVELEEYWRFLVQSGTRQEMEQFVAVAWRGVTASGRVVTRAELGGRIGEFPAIDLAVGADAVWGGDDLVVIGQAALGGRAVRCLHVFACQIEANRWEMVAASTTPVVAEPVAGGPAAAAYRTWPEPVPGPPATTLGSPSVLPRGRDADTRQERLRAEPEQEPPRGPGGVR